MDLTKSKWFMSFFVLIWCFISFLFQKEALGSINRDFVLNSGQLVVVDQNKNTSYQLRFFAKTASGWKLEFRFPVVIGKAGFAKLNEKVEGDAKTPSGVFSFGTSWGYAKDAPPTFWPYRQATDDDKFIDDPQSTEYNQWVRGETSARSYEKMRRNDGLYEFGVVINYNMNPVVPGKGSAIFLHVWRSSRNPTLGCVAMAKENILNLLAVLDPEKNPWIVLNPDTSFWKKIGLLGAVQGNFKVQKQPTNFEL